MLGDWLDGTTLLQPRLLGPRGQCAGPVRPRAEPCPIKFSVVTGRLCGPLVWGGAGEKGPAASRQTEGHLGHVGCWVTWTCRSRDTPQSAEGHVGAAELRGPQSAGCAGSGLRLRGSGRRPLGWPRVAHNARRAGRGAGPGAPVHQLPHPARPGAAQVGAGAGWGAGPGAARVQGAGPGAAPERGAGPGAAWVGLRVRAG